MSDSQSRVSLPPVLPPAGELSETIRTNAEPARSVSITLLNTPALLGLPAAPRGSLPEQRYETVGRLGAGGGGEVFLVTDTHLERDIALKVAQRSADKDPFAAARFVGEARLTARLEHPNILPVHDIGYDAEGRCYFSMRRANGRALNELIQEAAAGNVPVTIADVQDRVALMGRVCEAIAYAHSRGIVHRDIKPANIMLGDFGEVLVIDWGTALDLKTPTAHEDGKLIGTPLYMSPEQARAEPVDERSDVYCLGATLWHLLSFERPGHTGLSREEFWIRKQLGELPDVPVSLPPALGDILRKAMAPVPADRYQTPLELRAALKAWERHQASMKTCDRAEKVLADAEASGADYGLFAKLVGEFERALEDWAENARARRGLSRARGAYAKLALERGDVELAASVLDPTDTDHDGLRAQVQNARAKANEARRRVLRLRAAVAFATLCALVAVGWLVADWRRSIGAWTVGFAFDPATDPLSVLELAYPEPAAQAPRVEQGALAPTRRKLYFLNGAAFSGNVRVELEVEWPKAVDGLEIVLKAPRTAPPDPWGSVMPGLICQFGGYAGTVSFISQVRKGGFPMPWDGVGIDFEPRKRYRISFVAEGDEAALEVAGVEQHRIRNLLPLGDARYAEVAIRTWGEVLIHRITVHHQSIPQKPGPLLAGDVLVAHGHAEDAARMYERIAGEHAASRIGEEALGRACLAAALAPELKTDRARILKRLVDEHPKSAHRLRCEEASVRDAWAAGQLEQALGLAEQVLTRHPESRVALMLAEARPPRLPANAAQRLVRLLGRTDKLTRLHLNWLDIEDIGPLSKLKLVWLGIAATRVRDLSPLTGMPLKLLDVADTEVSDLGPLRGMPLEQLIIRGTPVTDLSPVRGAPLTHLDVSRTRVSSLAPVEGAPLAYLDVSQTSVSDLTPLGKSPLSDLRCGFSRVRDLAPLAGLALETLYVEHLGLTSIEPLRGMPLSQLEAGDNQITDIAPLKGMPGRRWGMLNLAGSPIRDLSPLAGMHGNALGLDRTGVRDISALASTRFRMYSLSSNPVTDLSPLAGTGVQRLNVTEVGPVRLAPLSGTSIYDIAIGGTPVRDLPVLAELPNLSELDVQQAGTAEELRQLATLLEKKGRPKALVRQVLAQAALMARDREAVRSLAESVAGRRIIYIQAGNQLPAALAAVSRLGARFPTIRTPEDVAALVAMVPGERNFWVDLQQRDGQWVWPNGTPVDRSLFKGLPRTPALPGRGYYAQRWGDGLMLSEHPAHLPEWYAHLVLEFD